jgi:hypothetical protein
MYIMMFQSFEADDSFDPGFQRETPRSAPVT